MSVNTKMTALADEIRTLSSTTEKIGLDEMATHVGEANMEITEQANLISQITTLVQQKTTPPSTDTNDATAGAGDILSGKTAYAKGRKITGTIASKAAATYTPSASNQTIASGQYLSGAQTIVGDTNLKAENIVSGVSIFGVTGTHSGAEDLDTELDTQESLISQLSTILDNKTSGGGFTTTEDWILLNSLPVTYANPLGPTEPGTTTTYYLEVPSNIRFVLFNAEMANKTAAILMCYWQRKRTISSGYPIFSEVFTTAGEISNLTVTEVSSDASSKILQIDDVGGQASWIYILPIYAPKY